MPTRVTAKWSARSARSSTTSAQALLRTGDALVVEAQSIDDGAVFAQTEDPGLRVSRLGFRRHSAGFHEAKAERQHRFGCFGVLVETRGQSDWIPKAETERFNLESRIVVH
jgi:hypothetical protein